MIPYHSADGATIGTHDNIFTSYFASPFVGSFAYSLGVRFDVVSLHPLFCILPRCHAFHGFLYKIKYNLLNISLPQHLVVQCTRTRNSDPNKFVQIPTRINTYAYSFYPRVIRAWNLLPNEILRLSSIDTFHQAVSTVQLAPPAHLNRL